jgi:hypothetical protein
MSLKKVIENIRVRHKTKKDEITLRAEALQMFLSRMEDLFPESVIFSGKVSQELAEFSRGKITRRRESNRQLSEALFALGLDAQLLASETEDFCTNKTAFTRRWVGELARRDETKLHQITPCGTFPTVLVAVRELWAYGYEGEIFARDIVKTIAEKVFISPAQRT